MIPNGRRNTDRIGSNAHGVYQGAILDLAGLPTMGFTLHKADGRLDMFYYHSVQDVDLTQDEHGEYLNWTHGNKAVTLRGRNLDQVIEALLAHTLISLHQFDDKLKIEKAAMERPYIQDVWITEVTPKKEHNAKVKSDVATSTPQGQG